MKKLVIQFHATPLELADCLMELRGEAPCSLALIKADTVVLIAKTQYIDHRSQMENLGGARILMSVRDAMAAADTPTKLLDANRNCLILDIGTCSDEELNESCLSAYLDPLDDPAMKFGARASSWLKRITATGVVAINPLTQAEAPLRTHRFSKGAKALFDRGVKMKPVAGNANLRLD